MNKLAQIKTVQGGEPGKPKFAVLVNLDIDEPETADGFIREVAKTFISQRMCSPPETDGMLITIIGDWPAARCVEVWKQIMDENKPLLFFMSQMRVADVIRGNAAGEQLEQVSLIEGYVFPEEFLKARMNPSTANGPVKEPAPGVMGKFRKLFGGK